MPNRKPADSAPALPIPESNPALTPLERALVNALIAAIMKELHSKGLHPSRRPAA
jgi:hypothetical protein